MDSLLLSRGEFVQIENGYEMLRQRYISILTHTHTYSGVSHHGGTVRPPYNYHQLSDWCVKNQIDALGMGSPYTPKSVKNYALYEGENRWAYYNNSEEIDQESLLQCDRDEVNRMLESINRMSNEKVHFYLDNETPKGRFGHLWWVGYEQEMTAWHDFDQDYDQWVCQHPDALKDDDEPMPFNRRTYSQIIAIQRSHGAVACWAHPTSWWRGNDGRFITNIATEMPAHVLADGYLDAMVVMGYQADRPEYRAIWRALLDEGFCVTPVAEMDLSLSATNLHDRTDVFLTYTPHSHSNKPHATIDSKQLAASIRHGHTVCSSGPLLELQAAGQPVGTKLEIAPNDRVSVDLIIGSSDPETRLDLVELVGRDGHVWWSQKDVPTGSVSIQLPPIERRDYLVAQAFSQRKSNGRYRDVAITAPIYLLPQGTSLAKPMISSVNLSIQSNSIFRDGEISFESALGESYEKGRVTGDTICQAMPANGRITLTAKNGHKSIIYLINANTRLQEIQQYLYRGRFLRNFPTLEHGDIPVKAWHLQDYRNAMENFSINI
ncbi:hypothetical protein [Poriferisphaera sp. WC338]|uniref:hypothetical protein n=1 Tax=Poriferisphaera sp. WC338 TaxID=3425129 RepID=UPI003D8173CD